MERGRLPVALTVLALAVPSLAACPGPTTPSRAPAAPPRGEVTPRRPPAGPPTARPIRLASWNLKRLGHGQKRIDLVAGIMRDQDVVALEEVMTPRGVDELVALMPGWAAIVSPAPVGRAGYAEHYAVLYRKDTLRRLDSFTVDDPRDEFAREPFVACLAAGEFDFCLVIIHVVFGSRVGPRDAEIAALGPLVDRLAARTAERGARRAHPEALPLAGRRGGDDGGCGAGKRE